MLEDEATRVPMMYVVESNGLVSVINDTPEPRVPIRMRNQNNLNVAVIKNSCMLKEFFAGVKENVFSKNHNNVDGIKLLFTEFHVYSPSCLLDSQLDVTVSTM